MLYHVPMRNGCLITRGRVLLYFNSFICKRQQGETLHACESESDSEGYESSILGLVMGDLFVAKRRQVIPRIERPAFGDVFQQFHGARRSSGHRLASDAFLGNTRMPRDRDSAASALQTGLRWDLALSHWLCVFAKLDL